MERRSKFSRQDIDKIVHRAFGAERLQVLNYNFEKYSEDKVGFLGSHQNLKIRIKRQSTREPEDHRFFVKRIPPPTEVHSRFIRERNLFAREAAYFNDILPLLKKFCPGADDWSPKCLLATDQFLVLEDLGLRHYAMSQMKMLNGEQLRAAFKAQARLHAASLVAEQRLAKPLGETFQQHMLCYPVLDLYTDLAEKVAERLGRDHRHFRAGFRKGIDQVHQRTEPSTRLPRVLVHGDAWSNNYLFDASEPPRCVLVDYQWIRRGSPMCDTVQLAYLSTTRQLRDRLARKAIEAYYQEFCEVLDKSDPRIKRPALKDFLEEYEELRATALLYAVMYYPVIWADKSIIDKYGEEQRYQKIMFRQDNSFVMQIYDEDESFAAKINEVVEEAVEYFSRRGVPVESD